MKLSVLIDEGDAVRSRYKSYLLAAAIIACVCIAACIAWAGPIFGLCIGLTVVPLILLFVCGILLIAEVLILRRTTRIDLASKTIALLQAPNFPDDLNQLLKDLSGSALIEKHEEGIASYVFPNLGMSVFTDFEGVIALHFNAVPMDSDGLHEAAFQGPLPFGIQTDSFRDDVHLLLGAPDETFTPHSSAEHIADTFQRDKVDVCIWFTIATEKIYDMRLGPLRPQ